MKIDGIGGPRKPGQAPTPEPAPRARGGRPQERAQGDRVELSKQTRRIAQLVGRAMELPEVRRGEIEALRRAIAEGRYLIDADRLAHAILEFEDGLLP